MSKELDITPKQVRLKKPKKPSIRQAKAIAISLENGGNISAAMREAGYSAAMSKNPHKFTDSVAYRTLADRIPDDLLERVHLEGLEATKMSGTGGMKIGLNAKGEVNDMGHTDIEMPDFAVRHKYLDSAYKLKGSYAAEKSVSLTLNAELDMGDIEKLQEIAITSLKQLDA